MEFAKIVPLEQNLWVINEMDKTTMFLINGTDKILLIDTGFGITDLKKIIKDLCGNKPIYVVNTHAHEDHNSGNNQFREIYVDRFDELYSHESMGKEKRALFGEVFFQEAIANGYDFESWNPGPSAQINSVKDGDVFDLGDYMLKVIEIPSHTMGSIALLEEKQGWLFSGDVVLTWSVWGHLTKGILAPSMSLKNYYDSIEKLREYSGKIKSIFPAHGTEDESPLDGCSHYRLPVKILDIYSEGIKKILQGEAETEAFSTPFENGEAAFFSIGGIVFQKERLK